MKKIRCLGDYIDGKTNVCYFIHRGDWGDHELINIKNDMMKNYGRVMRR